MPRFLGREDQFVVPKLLANHPNPQKDLAWNNERLPPHLSSEVCSKGDEKNSGREASVMDMETSAPNLIRIHKVTYYTRLSRVGLWIFRPVQNIWQWNCHFKARFWESVWHIGTFLHSGNAETQRFWQSLDYVDWHASQIWIIFGAVEWNPWDRIHLQERCLTGGTPCHLFFLF